ncbi:phosphoenolpyruvate carboxykinase [Polycladidibacter hongkongensis]|uniref:phosphoenolpyruvate carboxykinase n=1 Tax=Polycladidibacter hongkongensis TaxID=1647556 RepID=UPI00082BF837|nr:phosphoenolpyruvate carboxykinase [Pseudovibrio hongkongensis]
MSELGALTSETKRDALELLDLKALYRNLSPAQLYEYSIQRGESKIADGGALVAYTGEHTGRSPKDKFVVKDARTENAVWWDNSGAMTPQQFNLLLEDMRTHAKGMELFSQDLFGGADTGSRLATRVYTELAWHSLFIRNLLLRPTSAELADFAADMTILDLPSFKADPARHGCRSETVIACDFSRKIVLIAGTAYAGEMKKSVFTMLNFLLPEANTMPMHCSANTGSQGDTAVFFGLSGTGKTTLSADPNRILIGDDEHGWGENGIFNFEGGCYAKTINLSEKAEPEIYATTQRFGTILENVVLDEQRKPDFNDNSLTENTRCAYPINYIPNASASGRASHPKNIIMLTADAFGVLPPIAKLTANQAMYHFLSGYTAKVAGTERGVTEPQATFSTCFGAPFMPRHPSVYGGLLKKLIEAHEVDCWLVNTGWTGGAYGTGNRMPIGDTRALLSAALSGELKQSDFRRDENFGFEVPVTVAGVDAKLLDPRSTWAEPSAYDAQAAKLVNMFAENFAYYAAYVDADVCAAGPFQQVAAE